MAAQKAAGVYAGLRSAIRVRSHLRPNTGVIRHADIDFCNPHGGDHATVHARIGNLRALYRSLSRTARGGSPVLSAPAIQTARSPPRLDPDVGGKFEIELADDFVLATSNSTVITSATFTGLLTGTNPSVNDVVVEIYRVFPKDSDTGRTPNVPTRANSPSDVAFASRDSATPGDLTFTTNTLQQSFTAQNSVQAGGIHPKPNQTTKGDGQVTGTEVEFTVTFKTPLVLPPDHYFFVPQVGVRRRGVLVAVRSQTDPPAGHAVPARIYRSPELDPGSGLGSRLAAGRHRYRRPPIGRPTRPYLQRRLLADRNRPRARVARAPRNSTLCNGPNGIAATPPVLTADDCRHSAGVCRKPIAGG